MKRRIQPKREEGVSAPTPSPKPARPSDEAVRPSEGPSDVLCELTRPVRLGKQDLPPATRVIAHRDITHHERELKDRLSAQIDDAPTVVVSLVEQTNGWPQGHRVVLPREAVRRLNK